MCLLRYIAAISNYNLTRDDHRFSYFILFLFLIHFLGGGGCCLYAHLNFSDVRTFMAQNSFFHGLMPIGWLAWVPFHLRFFARNSNSMETWPWRYSVAGHQIATNVCTCHDSTAVVPCTKFCSDHCIRIEMRVKQNFHRIWIAMVKSLVKRPPCWSLLVNRSAR